MVDVGDDAKITDPLNGNVSNRAGGGFMGAPASLGDGSLGRNGQLAYQSRDSLQLPAKKSTNL